MSEMIERVARAIKAKLFEVTERDDEVTHAEIARAAIEAMREPTIEMAVAIDQCVEKYYPLVVDGPVHCWRDGVDAALNTETRLNPEFPLS